MANLESAAVKAESATEDDNTNQEQGNIGNLPNNQNHGGGQVGCNEGGNRGRGRGYIGGRGGPGGRRQFNMKRDIPDYNNRKPAKRSVGQSVGGGGGGLSGSGGGGGGGMRGEQGGLISRNADDRLMDRVMQISGPTFDLPLVDTSEKKFSGRSRLYIGNISSEVTEDDISQMFKAYGDLSELFLNKEKNFGFIRLDYHVNAEKAKKELDGTMLKGRTLKIRFAPNGSTIKVKNLSQYVSNEVLYWAFSIFGEIERCIVIVDDRGKPTGEGIVEYSRKGSAVMAIRKCSERCFFLTSSLRPVIVEQYDAVDDTDGHPDKNIPKKNAEFLKAREIGPRFANTNSFEHEYGMRWKQLHELYSQKEQALKKELEMEKEKLEAQMEYARYEHETEMLREQLRVREMDRERQKREWEMKERQAEESRQRNEEQMRRQQEEMQNRILHQEEELRRRQQENSLFMQAHQLDNMLDQQEQAYDQPDHLYNSNIPSDMGPPGNQNMDPKAFLKAYDRNHRFDGREMGQLGPRAGGNMGGRGHWVNENRGGGGNRDDFPSKRRRY